MSSACFTTFLALSFRRYPPLPPRRIRSPDGSTSSVDFKKLPHRGGSAPRSVPNSSRQNAGSDSRKPLHDEPEVTKSKSLPPKNENKLLEEERKKKEEEERKKKEEEERKEREEKEEQKRLEFEERLRRLPTPGTS